MASSLSLPIGDFSRATHMSIKTLRHYHRVGLLEPADVDQFTGHRRYTTEQIPTAQVIRRFRGLDMPIEDIRGILTAPDVPSRNELIAAHLSRLEESLARTQTAVASLRDLLDHPEDPARTDISHRSVAGTRAAAITAVIDIEDASSWYQGALGELQATVSAQGLTASGAPGGVYAADLFTNERGQATVFIPCAGQIRPVGRLEGVELPPAELAIIVHQGPHDNIDRAYGALGTHVTQHALAVEGPIREYYLCGRHDTPDESAWRTEIGWPIFQLETARRRFEARHPRHPIHGELLTDAQWERWRVTAQPLQIGPTFRIDTTGPVDTNAIIAWINRRAATDPQEPITDAMGLSAA